MYIHVYSNLAILVTNVIVNVHVFAFTRAHRYRYANMGWLWLVGSIKL